MYDVRYARGHTDDERENSDQDDQYVPQTK